MHPAATSAIDPATAEEMSPPLFPKQIDLKTVVMMGTLLLGVAGNWFTFSARLDEQSRRLQSIEERLNRDLVPRQEHDMRNQDLNARLGNIDSTLRELQIQLGRQQNQNRNH